MRNKGFRIFILVFGGLIGVLTLIFGIMSKDQSLLLTGGSFMALYAIYAFKVIPILKEQTKEERKSNSPLMRR